MIALDPADLAEPAHPTDPAEILRRDRANLRVAEGSPSGPDRARGR
ncbi:MAG: hypothetical protein R3B09_19605 [Nannocystaceae bacterium]